MYGPARPPHLQIRLLDPDVLHLDPAGLLLVHLDHVILLHLQGLGRLVVVDPAAVEKESKTGNWNSHLIERGHSRYSASRHVRTQDLIEA